MPMPPHMEADRFQWPQVAPSDGPPHQPFVIQWGRFPKHPAERPANRPLLHARRRVVRCRGRRMHEASILSARGQHPSLPRIRQCIGFRNPSLRGRPRRGRLRVFGCSRRIRTGERHLPRRVAFPARDRPPPSVLEMRCCTLGRGTRPIPRQQRPAKVCRQRFARHPISERRAGIRHSVVRVTRRRRRG